jgi:hypothetical protein
MKDAAPHTQCVDRLDFHSNTTIEGNINRKSSETPHMRRDWRMSGLMGHPSVTRAVFQWAFLRKKIIEFAGTL